MSPPNIDPANGIRIGFCSGHPYPELLDLIEARGRDLTYERWKTQTRSSLQSCLADIDNEGGRDRDWWASTFAATGSHCGADVGAVAHDAAALVDLETGTFDIDEVLDVLMHGACDTCQIDSEDWLYEAPGIRIALSTRNGPILAIELSPYATRCELCSPCLPNGGDLDNPTEDGIWTYCIPPALADVPYPTTLVTNLHD